MINKKFIAAMLALFLTAAVLVGCGNNGKQTDDAGKISVVCTIFPQYDLCARSRATMSR
jgi:ABC-type Zn uptake system ZnuABC Zn-binding protein ZnuA